MREETTPQTPRRYLRFTIILLAGAALCAGAAMLPSHGGSQVTNVQAAVLGVVEGLTECLPVSSTGQLILASHAMGLSELGGRSGPLGPEVVKSPAVAVTGRLKCGHGWARQKRPVVFDACIPHWSSCGQGSFAGFSLFGVGFLRR